MLTGSISASTRSVARVTAVSGYTTHSQCWVRVGDHPIGQREGPTHDCRVGVASRTVTTAHYEHTHQC